jgi:hypothetical protein
MKRTFIPPSLRPAVAGSRVDSSIIPPTSSRLSSIHINKLRLVVIAASTDYTSEYFLNHCRLPAEQKWRCLVDCDDVNKLVELLHSWQESTLPPAIYARIPSTNNSSLARILEYINDFLQIYKGNVVSGSNRQQTNFSKPLQSTKLWRGFKNPVTGIESLINRRGVSSHFPVICKSISGERSLVRAVSNASVVKDGEFLACPAYFQQIVYGTHFRLHVCGNSISAARIESNFIDYREDPELKIDETRVPKCIQEWALNAVRSEGLQFAGIDLLREENSNQWRCFELNPSPGYHFFEERMNSEERPITQALESYLLAGRST